MKIRISSAFIRVLIPFQNIQQSRPFCFDIDDAITTALQLSDLFIEKIIVVFPCKRDLLTTGNGDRYCLRSRTEIAQVLRSVDCSNASAADHSDAPAKRFNFAEVVRGQKN